MNVLRIVRYDFDLNEFDCQLCGGSTYIRRYYTLTARLATINTNIEQGIICENCVQSDQCILVANRTPGAISTRDGWVFASLSACPINKSRLYMQKCERCDKWKECMFIYQIRLKYLQSIHVDAYMLFAMSPSFVRSMFLCDSCVPKN